VQRIVGGRYAPVFQERGIQRLDYVGPPVVWRARIISASRGTLAPFSVVNLGYFSFFLAQDGWFITNGSQVEPIGTQRVNRWFRDNVNQDKIGEVQGAIDWQNEAIIWSFHGEGSEVRNRLLVYSFAEGRWSTATVTVDWLVGSNLDGIDLDSLDAIYGDLDSIPGTLDSSEFASGDRRLAAFVKGATTSEYNLFTGDPLEAEWVTGEFQPSPSRRVFVSEVTPLMEATDWDMTAQLQFRNNRGQEEASSTATAGWAGFCAVRGEGQKMAVRLTKPSGSWQRAQGIQVRFRPAGFR